MASTSGHELQPTQLPSIAGWLAAHASPVKCRATGFTAALLCPYARLIWLLTEACSLADINGPNERSMATRMAGVAQAAGKDTTVMMSMSRMLVLS